jgi:hypothetical protein
MDTLDTIVFLVFDSWEWAMKIYHSFGFAVFKFIVGLYIVVIVADIILLLLQRGLSGDIADTRLGMNVPPELVRNRDRKKLRIKWGRIKSRLNSSRERQYKLAVLEADRLIDDLIYRMGYKNGANFGERLDNIPLGQIETVESLKEAHKVRNQIVLDDNFKLDKEAAQKTLGLFEEFLAYHEVIKE